MITTEMRYHLTIETIKYSDAYDDNFDLFNQGIKILEERIKTQNYEEFTVDERELLEEISEIMETFNIPKDEKIKTKEKFQMNFRTFKLTSKIDTTDYMLIEIDMDTIDDDEPTMNLIEESLDVCEHLLCPHSKEFVDDWEADDQFLQCCHDMTSEEKIQSMERNKYIIELG